MSSQASVYRRVTRREIHSPRSGLAITVGLVLLVLMIAVIVGCVFLMLNLPAAGAVTAFVGGASRLSPLARGVTIAAGIVAVILGAFFVVVALAPGRRARRKLEASRVVAVVDDKVVARTLAMRAARAAGVARDKATVVVGRRRATVRIVPTAGTVVDVDGVRDAVHTAGEPYGLRREPRVRLAERAEVG